MLLDPWGNSRVLALFLSLSLSLSFSLSLLHTKRAFVFCLKREQDRDLKTGWTAKHKYIGIWSQPVSCWLVKVGMGGLNIIIAKKWFFSNTSDNTEERGHKQIQQR
jgi:hypothetical protein